MLQKSIKIYKIIWHEYEIKMNSFLVYEYYYAKFLINLIFMKFRSTDNNLKLQQLLYQRWKEILLYLEK